MRPIMLRCSFCHKSESDVGHLISSPSDYPRTYICDECVQVCALVLENNRPAPADPPIDPDDQVEQLLNALAAWACQDALGQDAFTELAAALDLARAIFAQ